MSSKSHTSPGPLFDTPADRVLAAAPRQVARLLRRYLQEPLGEVLELREQVRRYLQQLEATRDAEFLDLKLARRLAAQCEALLEGFSPSSSIEHRSLVQAAVRYFVEPNDAEGDATSPIGFDDDAQVVELVARELGRHDVLRIGEAEE